MAWEVMQLALRIFWRRLGLLLLANVAWLCLSLLIVPWPAVTAGLFTLVKHIVAEELGADPRQASMRDFWEGMRRYWLRSSLTALLDLFCLGLLVIAMRFYGESQIEVLSWLIGPITLIGLVWTGAQLYIFPLLLHRTERSVIDIIREAFLMAMSYPLLSSSIALTSVMISIGSIVLAGPILLVFFSFMALLQTITLRSVLVQRGEIATMLVTIEQRIAIERSKKVLP